MIANSVPEWGIGRSLGGEGFAPSVARVANRRRLRVFLGTLVVALIVSLAYTFLRPAVYRASARLEITPAAAAPASMPTQTQISIAGPEPVRPFLTEVQVLTSRPVLEEVLQRLNSAGTNLAISARIRSRRCSPASRQCPSRARTSSIFTPKESAPTSWLRS